MHRRSLLLTAGALGALPLIGCGEKPPPPTVLGLTMKATPDANQDGTGAAKPLRVRVLRLSGTAMFLQADFFALDTNPMKALGKELAGFDDFVLPPGGTVPFEREVEMDARFAGVMGAYFQIDRAQWRAVKPLKRSVTNLMIASFNVAGVTLEETGA